MFSFFLLFLKLKNTGVDIIRLGKQKKFKQGDQIHIVVTTDFAQTANQFYDICKKNHFNASEVIRSSIGSWVTEQQVRLELYDNMRNKRRDSS